MHARCSTHIVSPDEPLHQVQWIADVGSWNGVTFNWCGSSHTCVFPPPSLWLWTTEIHRLTREPSAIHCSWLCNGRFAIFSRCSHKSIPKYRGMPTRALLKNNTLTNWRRDRFQKWTGCRNMNNRSMYSNDLCSSLIHRTVPPNRYSTQAVDTHFECLVYYYFQINVYWTLNDRNKCQITIISTFWNCYFVRESFKMHTLLVPAWGELSVHDTEPENAHSCWGKLLRAYKFKQLVAPRNSIYRWHTLILSEILLPPVQILSADPFDKLTCSEFANLRQYDLSVCGVVIDFRRRAPL